MLKITKEYKLFGGSFGVLTSSFSVFSESGVIDENALQNAIKEVELTRCKGGSKLAKVSALQREFCLRKAGSFFGKMSDCSTLLLDGDGYGVASLGRRSRDLIKNPLFRSNI